VITEEELELQAAEQVEATEEEGAEIAETIEEN